MKQELVQEMQQERWSSVMYDASAIDGDIELLIGALQKSHGYSRQRANAELLRKLSKGAA